MQGMQSDSFDSIVTDPPYGLNFMGKEWDHGVPAAEFWRDALRIAKPGAHLLAFGGTRTHHRLACAVEDAGWEIRDCVMWVYGSGFPKSLNVSQAMDKAARGCPQGSTKGDPLRRGKGGLTDRNALSLGGGNGRSITGLTDKYDQYVPVTESAKLWQGWGTALKPAWEPIIVARKPVEGTVADNVSRHGTGALNIDGCRVPTHDLCCDLDNDCTCETSSRSRWPANVIHDGSDEVLELFPHTTSGSRKAASYVVAGGQGRYGKFRAGRMPEVNGDFGSAARFFYCAKASKADRNDGCAEAQGNHHPTVKPTALMRYLCRLVTPPNGIILDPFMGSGSTGKAALLEGFQFVGCEINAEYVRIADARLRHV